MILLETMAKDSPPQYLLIERFRSDLSQKPLDSIDLRHEILELYRLFPRVALRNFIDNIFSSDKPTSRNTDLFDATIKRLQFLAVLPDWRKIVEQEELFPY